MKKQVMKVTGGVNARVGDFLVNRLLPGTHTQAVGPFVFLDHVYPVAIRAGTPKVPTGAFAHPHRGIATFSYVLQGSLSHYDSKGNHDVITAGGIQWMKAGNGIIHDEQPGRTEGTGDIFHSLQFWINLPSQNKAEPAEYLAVQAGDVPGVELPDHGGAVRILLGAFGSISSQIKTFSPQCIFHFRLNPKASYTFVAKNDWEYAAFIPSDAVSLNGIVVGESKTVLFETAGEEIILENDHIFPADILLFGGETYRETIVSQGPFVMNSYAEIATAYRDFFDGKYGAIEYVKD